MSSLTDLAFAGAAAPAAAVRAGEVSAVELVEGVLARIERLQPRLNCFTHVLADAALAAARLVQPGDAAPLAGVPVAVKDNTDVAGLPTEHGLRAATPAARDSLAVARLRAAGAIPVGKTALPELARWGHFTSSRAHGVTRNPWNPARSPGGSSGGTAAAVAAGLAGVGLGSDAAARSASPPPPAGCSGSSRSAAASRCCPTPTTGTGSRTSGRSPARCSTLTPTVAAPMPTADAGEGKGMLRTFVEMLPYAIYTAPWNGTGQPAASVPAGFDADGMPTAVQLVARPDGEAAIVAVAAEIQRARPWALHRPPL